MDIIEKYLTTAEVAQILNVTRETVREYCKAGTLEAFRQGRQNLIPQSSLDAYLDDMKNKKVTYQPHLAKTRKPPLRKKEVEAVSQ